MIYSSLHRIIQWITQPDSLLNLEQDLPRPMRFILLDLIWFVQQRGIVKVYAEAGYENNPRKHLYRVEEGWKVLTLHPSVRAIHSLKNPIFTHLSGTQVLILLSLQFYTSVTLLTPLMLLLISPVCRSRFRFWSSLTGRLDITEAPNSWMNSSFLYQCVINYYHWKSWSSQTQTYLFKSGFQGMGLS